MDDDAGNKTMTRGNDDDYLSLLFCVCIYIGMWKYSDGLYRFNRTGDLLQPSHCAQISVFWGIMGTYKKERKWQKSI